jgi:hypothetical protein
MKLKLLLFVGLLLMTLLLLSAFVQAPTVAVTVPKTVIVASPPAQEPEPIEIPKTFMQVVQLLGSPLLLGVVLSLMFKEWVWFIAQKPWVKWLMTLGVCLFLPILSQVLQEYLPASAWNFLEHWWPVAAGGLAVWVASQVWNQIYNKKIDRQYSVFEPAAATKQQAADNK